MRLRPPLPAPIVIAIAIVVICVIVIVVAIVIMGFGLPVDVLVVLGVGPATVAQEGEDLLAPHRIAVIGNPHSTHLSMPACLRMPVKFIILFIGPDSFGACSIVVGWARTRVGAGW